MPLPDMADALDGLGETVSLIVVSKGIGHFEVIEKEEAPIRFEGVLQPLTAMELKIKPEGQRQWKLWHLWTTERLEFDWIVQTEDGIKLRVLPSAQNWGSYSDYTLTENPTL